MRKNILLLFAIAASAISFGQANYTPFEENTLWRVDQTNNAPVPALNCSGTYHYHLFLQGDTTLSAKTYKKIYRSDVFESSFSGQSNCFPYPEYATNGYAGAIYDDPLADIVYFIPSSLPDTMEYVLYDYNLIVGDTINSAMVLCDRIVTNIDTVTIDGIDRKRWHYLSCDSEPEFYIEGLGSSHGLIEPTGLAYMTADLICIQKNGNTIYQSGVNSAFGCYGVFAGIDNKEHDRADFSIYPNPATETAIVHYESKVKPTRVEILNQLGEQITFESIQNEEQLEINTAQLANGLYFVKITLENEILSKSLVIQH